MKAIIHIGTPKTGTTTIQQFLVDNAEALKKQNIFIPDSDFNFHRVLGCFFNTFALEETMWHFPTIQRVSLSETDRKDTKNWYEKQIFTRKQTVIFSSELLSFFVKSEIQLFKEWLCSLFDEVQIILYLRRQPEYLVSYYMQLAKCGLFSNDITFLNFYHTLISGKQKDYCSDNYQHLLENWCDVFGKENINLRLFDRKEMFQNDLLKDFCFITGINISNLKHSPSRNESLDVETMEFLRKLKQFPYIEGKNFNTYRSHLICYSEEKFGKSSNKGYNLSQAEAKEILDHYRESNNAVAREYLGREQLFSDDVSMYPVETAPHNLTVEKCADIFSVLWKAVIDDKIKTESELNQLKYQIERRRVSNRLKRLGKKIKKIPQRCIKFVNKINKAAAALLMIK
jgi:hypothetical protein